MNRLESLYVEEMHATELVERQNGKRGLESGFGSAGYVNEI